MFPWEGSVLNDVAFVLWAGVGGLRTLEKIRLVPLETCALPLDYSGPKEQGEWDRALLRAWDC